MPATLPETFGRYRILKKLGEGGMGAVYLAEDTRMHRKVALKVPHFDAKESSLTLDRFYREARVAAELRHPSLCPVYDVDCVESVHFLTMAYIEGTPLADYVNAGKPWPPAHVVALICHIADALVALHARGIVHRDLKPANVMIQPDGVPVLLDFGLARSIVAESQKLTAEGASLGTPAYMAPEQIDSQAELITPRTDVYALGVMFFQLLTGRLPFRPTSLAQLYALILRADRPRPSDFADGIHPDLDALALEMMASEPDKRPATMAQLMERLRRCRTKAPPSGGVPTQCPHCTKSVRIPQHMLDQGVICPGCKRPIEPNARPTVAHELPQTRKLATDTKPLEVEPVPDVPPPPRSSSRPGSRAPKRTSPPIPPEPPALKTKTRRPTPVAEAEKWLGKKQNRGLALTITLVLGAGAALVVAFFLFCLLVYFVYPPTPSGTRYVPPVTEPATTPKEKPPEPPK